MAKEFWYFIGGMLAIILPLAALVVIKKFDLFDAVADERITYSQVGGRNLRLHLFRPTDGPDSPTPALLFFHGGAWRFGGPEQFYPQCRYFAQRGYTCFSAEYRLAPHDPPDMTGAIEDAANALDYLHDHAQQLGIAAERIYVGGGSAGGHLAAALGTGLHGQDRTRPAGLVLLNPVLDFSDCTPFHHLAGDNWRAVSPLQHVDASFPPTLIQSGSLDVEVTVAAVESFCSAVADAGGRCESVIYEGQRHGFFNPGNGSGDFFGKTSDAMAEFLHGLR